MQEDEIAHRRQHGLTRRETLAAAGVAAFGLTLGSGLADLPALGAGSALGASLLLTPEQEEGPYYVDLERVRRNIVAGQAGVPLTFAVHVLHATTGAPIEGAAVDVWHCSPLGIYSDEAVEKTVGKTFLRGVQLTDAAGEASFLTLYPGHYAGRAVHIHVKVHVSGSVTAGTYAGGRVCHTGQVFFDDAISGEVFRLSPYAKNKVARVLNRSDRVYAQQGGSGSLASLSRRGAGIARGGFNGEVALVVEPDSTPQGVGVGGGSSGGGSGRPSA
jgi:protocatechuate 3,4-dioxygenase beta subunit